MSDDRSKDFLQSVKDQYEELPYPPRDPALETQRLLHKIGDNLIILNHHCFQGQRDFSQGFRALVAGGGTGDATIYLAEQLRELGGEVVYLDLSEASMAVARERARIRDLNNIEWINDSIMNLPGLDIGEFDYISCTGVLHHLESTEGGLAALKSVLKDDGVILLMLYGKYGRRSVYDMQSLLRDWLPAGTAIADKIQLTRQLLDRLPATNSFHRDLDRWRYEISPEGFGDSGLYDLLLHSQDRCFSVPELYELAASAQFDLLGFVDRASQYDPASFLEDRELLASMDELALPQRQSIAEQIGCDLNSHEFYLGRAGQHRPAALADQDNALVMMGEMHGKHAEIGAGLVPGRKLSFSGRGGELSITGNPINRLLFAHMDGVTPVRQVCERIVQALPEVTEAQVESELAELYDKLHGRGYLYLLRSGSYGNMVPDYNKMQPF